jgi:hypothetical protein
MTISPASFRQDFTEFASLADYTDASIQFYINLGTMLVNEQTFGPGSLTAVSPPTNLYDMLLELFTAHNLVLEKPALKASENGGVPGVTTGPISSKRVGPASVSYDVGLGVDPKDAQWNLTIYGVRFIAIYKLPIIAGFVANGGGNANFGPFPAFPSIGWSGPPLWGWGPWQ